MQSRDVRVRDEHVFMARLAEMAKRCDDMVEYMKGVAVMGPSLSLRRTTWEIAVTRGDKLC